MENYNRIDWKKGLDITPDIFIRSDDYHVAQRNFLGRFFAYKIYGILPNSRFHIETRINNRKISVDYIECKAITNDGCLINLQNNIPYASETEIEENGEEFYLFLIVNPYTLPAEPHGFSASHKYGFVCKNIEEPIEKGVPVAKFIKDFQSWVIDDNYIPPSMALNAVEKLLNRYTEIKNIITEIIRKLPEEYPFYFQITMLDLELNHYALYEPPEGFVLLMKKFVLIFQHYLKTVKNLEESPVLKTFMEEPYRHYDIKKSFYRGFEALMEINQKIEEKPVVKEEVAVFEIKI